MISRNVRLTRSSRDARLARDAVAKSSLAGAAHDEQAAGRQLESAALAVARAARHQRQPPRGAERQRRHDRIGSQLRLVVRVQAHVVAAVAIAVEQDVVEMRAGEFVHAVGERADRVREGARLEGLARVAVRDLARPAHEPRLHDPLAVKDDLALGPRHLGPHGGETALCFGRGKPGGLEVEPAVGGERDATHGMSMRDGCSTNRRPGRFLVRREYA